MSVKDLTQGDFEYFRQYLNRDRTCHEDEFMAEANPDLMHALYRGYKDPQYKLNLKDPQKLKNHIVTYSKIFTATNTIVLNLMYQMPRYLVVPEHGTDPNSAAAMTSALNYYNKVLKQKQENQQAVLNAWFMGLAWKKVGYYAPQAPKVKSPETDGVEASEPEPGALQFGNLQHTFLEEGPFNSFESPMNVLIDHKGTLNSFKIITHRLCRTLQDIYEYGSYDPEMVQMLVEKHKDQNGSRFDAREVKFQLFEQMIEQRNGIYLLVSVDGFDKPLFYDRMDTKKITWYPLALTNEPNVRYPVSHMGVASRSQRWIDEITSKYVEMIGKIRNQHFINENILAKGQSKESFLKNLIGGVYWGQRPATNGDIVEIKSSQISPDIQAIINMLTGNVVEILGSDNQRISCKSSNETLGQDKIAAIGTEIRESGMLDKVRDWLIDQGDCMVTILKKKSGAQLKLKIDKNDFAKQEYANQALGQEQVISQEFRTPNQPMPLSYFTQDGEYGITINVYEAVKPNKKELSKEYDEFMAIYSAPLVKSSLLEMNKRVRLDLVAEERAKLFEYLDSSRFIEELTPEQKTAIQVQQMMMEGKVGTQPTPMPQEGLESPIPEKAGEVPYAA